MRILRANSSCIGFTVLEVMVVLFTITVLAAMLLPVLLGGRGYNSTNCMNNQRQCALGFILFMSENNNQHPWDLAATNSAHIPGCTKGDAAADFNELQGTYIKTPYVFVCPSDPVKVALIDLSPLKN